jgi:hypothetical protein
VCRLLSWFVLVDGKWRRTVLRSVWLSSDGENDVVCIPFFVLWWGVVWIPFFVLWWGVSVAQGSCQAGERRVDMDMSYTRVLQPKVAHSVSHK